MVLAVKRQRPMLVAKRKVVMASGIPLSPHTPPYRLLKICGFVLCPLASRMMTYSPDSTATRLSTHDIHAVPRRLVCPH